MSDLFQEECTKNLSKLVFEIAKSIGSVLLEKIKSKEKSLENYFYKISEKYYKRFSTRYGYIQILGMNEPMSLTNIFVDVKVLDSISNKKYLSIKDLERSFTSKESSLRNLQHQNDYKEDGIIYAEQENRLMVLGAPGGGKSTYLRKVAIESLSPHNSILSNYIPIMIELKNIDHKNTIASLLLEELSIADFPDPPTFLEESLKNGNLLILFDGLDEVPSEYESLTIKSIKDFCDLYSKNRFIVSCRVAAYKGGLTNFRNIEIANLDPKQIQDFITKWFQEKTKDKKNKISIKCWESINKPEYKATLELAQTPLLLTLLCLVYHYQQDFPQNRSILYRDAINVLLKEWNAEKRIHSNTIYKDMTLPFEEMLLSKIAYDYFEKNEYFFDKDELSQFISSYISNNLNAPKYLDGSQILEAISVQQGILVERAKNIYSFSHLTFQEYFTAKYIDDHNLLQDVINKHLLNPKWREIFILLCGIMKAGSDNLLLQINTKALNEVKETNEYIQIIKIIEKDSINTNLKSRIINLFLTLLYCTNFPIYKTGQGSIFLFLIREVDRELYEDVAQSWIIDKKTHVQLHYELYLNLVSRLKSNSFFAQTLEETLIENHLTGINTIRKVFCNKMGISDISISPSSIVKIETYIINLFFLFQCKKTSILVSKDKWEIIENSLFMA